jgi:hypothetical protein
MYGRDAQGEFNATGNSTHKALKVNSTLQEIGFSSNNIGAEGAQYIAEALKVNLGGIELELEPKELNL